MSSPRPHRDAVTPAAALILAGGTVALYWRATRLWWMFDDFFDLRFVHAWKPYQYSLDPHIWRQLPFRMLTPLVYLSLGSDLALFGPRPAPFYWHQLAALAAVAVTLFALLRLWLPLSWSFLGAFLFLVSPPVASLPPVLMHRHYEECVLLSLLATLTWVWSLRASTPLAGWSLAIGSAALWFLASVAKEISLPLVAVLPLLPVGPVAQRLRRLMPHALALLLYLIYRWHMLGTLVGGYGWAIQPLDWPKLVVLLPVKIGHELLGVSSVAGWTACACLVAGAAVLLRRRGRGAALVAIALALAWLPVLPVSTEMLPRYAVLSALVLTLAFVFGARQLRGGAWLAVAAAVAALVANRQVWHRELQDLERMSAENQSLLALPAGAFLRQPAAAAASLREMRLFAPEFLGAAVRGGWFADDLFLCRGGDAVHRLFQYDAAAGRVVETTAALPALRRGPCADATVRPLSAAFTYRDGVLRWQLGPYADGRWWLVFDDGVEIHEVPRRAGFQFPGLQSLVLRVRFDAAAHWRTYSPPLRLDGTRSTGYRWHRP